MGGLDDRNREKTVDTAHPIMNWMVFANAPTWFWLHALKPACTDTSVGSGPGPGPGSGAVGVGSYCCGRGRWALASS